MYDLDEFLQCAMMNCDIILVTGGMDNPKKTITTVNRVRPKGMKFTCWDIENGKLVLYIDED
jgi:hypothetical protein